MMKNFVNAVNERFEEKINDKNELVFVFIGTPRSIGDSVAPFTGTLLQEEGFTYENVFFYGTLENPIHAQNLEKKIKEIKEKHQNALIIGVDCALTSKDENLDKIIFENKPIQPGKSVGKDLKEVGDFSIQIVIAKSFDDEMFNFMLLGNISLNYIYNKAKETKEIIKYITKEFDRIKSVNKVEIA